MHIIHLWLDAYCALLLFWLGYAVVELWRDLRRARREVHRLREELQAADTTGTQLAGELLELKEFAGRLAATLELSHACNRDLACQLYGQEAVDRAEREAASRGKN